VTDEEFTEEELADEEFTEEKTDEAARLAEEMTEEIAIGPQEATVKPNMAKLEMARRRYFFCIKIFASFKKVRAKTNTCPYILIHLSAHC
jgi:hypothetical protein